MQIDSFLLNITSDQPDALRDWYRDVLQLPELEGMPAFDAGGAMLSIDSHSEVHGKAAEPARMLLNLIVPDLATEHERLLAAGVECLREPAREEWGGLITTFLDPDGNYVQLVQMPPEGSAALAEDAEQYSAP